MLASCVHFLPKINISLITQLVKKKQLNFLRSIQKQMGNTFKHTNIHQKTTLHPIPSTHRIHLLPFIAIMIKNSYNSDFCCT